MTRKKGTKPRHSLSSDGGEISKYKRIVEVKFQPGRPGEELFEVVDEDGKKTQISVAQKRELDALMKKKK